MRARGRFGHQRGCVVGPASGPRDAPDPWVWGFDPSRRSGSADLAIQIPYLESSLPARQPITPARSPKSLGGPSRPISSFSSLDLFRVV